MLFVRATDLAPLSRLFGTGLYSAQAREEMSELTLRAIPRALTGEQPILQAANRKKADPDLIASLPRASRLPRAERGER